MKAYGQHRRDQVSLEAQVDCPCCTTYYHRKRNCRLFADKQRRKSARQFSKLTVQLELSDTDKGE